MQKDVPHVGDAGEMKEVRDGYARNWLIPRRLAIIAQAGSARAIEHHKQMMERKRLKRQTIAEGLAEKLTQIGKLEIPVRVGANEKMYGSVTSRQISQVLQEKGFHLDRRKIELEERIRSLGSYKIQIRLAEKVSVPFEICAVPLAKPESQKAEKREPTPSARTEQAKAKDMTEEKTEDEAAEEETTPADDAPEQLQAKETEQEETQENLEEERQKNLQENPQKELQEEIEEDAQEDRQEASLESSKE